MSAYLVAADTPSPVSDRAGLDLDRFPLNELLTGCVANLKETFDGAAGLFPFVTRLVDGQYANDYSVPPSERYTINTLLGLHAAAQHGIGIVTPDAVASMTEAFLQRRRPESLADNGLLALLLCEQHADSGPIEAAIDRLRSALASGRGPRLDVQTLSWTIWGATAATRRGVAAAEDVALHAADVVDEHFVDRRSGMPRHSTRWYRRSIVSFGSLTYFLRAAHELATTFDERRWHDAFESGVEHAIGLQGPLGEWPWMMNVRSGTPFDAYPVFSVHQDSMAMLFLLPALDRDLPGAKAAIERSLAWVFGANELGTGFYLTDPFFAYRSIERVERAPRLRRYGRGLAYTLFRRPARFGGTSVRVNEQCRSYHLGWILYVWAGRLARERDAAGRDSTTVGA
jgi:hypothetical protein